MELKKGDDVGAGRGVGADPGSRCADARRGAGHHRAVADDGVRANRRAARMRDTSSRREPTESPAADPRDGSSSTPPTPTLIAATVDTTHTTVALTDLAGNIAAEERIDVAVADGPVGRSTRSSTARAGLLERNGARRSGRRDRDQRAGPRRSRHGPPEPASDHARLGRVPDHRAPPRCARHSRSSSPTTPTPPRSANSAALTPTRDRCASSKSPRASGPASSWVARCTAEPTAAPATSVTSRSRGMTTWSASAARTGALPRSHRAARSLARSPRSASRRIPDRMSGRCSPPAIQTPPASHRLPAGSSARWSRRSSRSSIRRRSCWAG